MKRNLKRCRIPAAALAVLILSAACSSRTDEDKLRDLMKDAREDRAWPGAVLIAGNSDSVIFRIAEGFKTYDRKEAVETNALFDLASITKVIATTSAAMKLYQEDRFDLDMKVQDIIPEFDGPDEFSTVNKKKVTFRHLLTHTSGLEAFRHFWTFPDPVESRLDSVYRSRLLTEPGTDFVYSDIGLITLGKSLERITGQGLDVYCRDNIFLPLGMKNTGFNPSPDLLSRIMPTEYSEDLGTFVLGVVHDENARSLGGVAGHAGLFSTADDLAAYCTMILHEGKLPDGSTLFRKDVIDLFAKPAGIIPGDSRCLGWDSPSGNASGGVFISSNSIGHTGFTGTSLWIDRENGLYVILLTNAVHPDRRNKEPEYFDWRQKIHSSVYEKLGLDKRNPDLTWRERWRK